MPFHVRPFSPAKLPELIGEVQHEVALQGDTSGRPEHLKISAILDKVPNAAPKSAGYAGLLPN